MNRIRSILVTGSTGMLGRNVVEAFAPLPYRLLTPGRKELDLLDERGTLHWLDKNRPDAVIHCAGLVGGIKANISMPERFLVDNMRINLNIISAAKNSGARYFLNIGSSCMYPANCDKPLTEDMILSGSPEPTNEGFALAKCAAARLCQYINRENPGYHYKTIIPCNLYGRHDHFDPEKSHLIAAIIQKIDRAIRNRDAEVVIWGDGKARREFMYVGDAAHFITMLVGRFDDLPEIMNIGAGKDHAVNEFYEIVGRIMGYAGAFVHDLEKPAGMRRKLLDISKQKEFGFEPEYGLEEGIIITCAHYSELYE